MSDINSTENVSIAGLKNYLSVYKGFENQEQKFAFLNGIENIDRMVLFGHFNNLVEECSTEGDFKGIFGVGAILYFYMFNDRRLVQCNHIIQKLAGLIPDADPQQLQECVNQICLALACPEVEIFGVNATWLATRFFETATRTGVLLAMGIYIELIRGLTTAGPLQGPNITYCPLGVITSAVVIYRIQLTVVVKYINFIYDMIDCSDLAKFWAIAEVRENLHQLNETTFQLEDANNELLVDATLQANIINVRNKFNSILERAQLPAPQPAPQSAPESTPEPTPESTQQSGPDPIPEPIPQSAPEPTPQSDPEPTPETTQQSGPEPIPETTPQTAPEITPEPIPESTNQSAPEPIPEHTPQSAPEPTPVPTQQSAPESTQEGAQI